MIEKLVTFGDSWPAGAELADQDLHTRFPDVVAKNLKLESVNLSQCGTSIDHAVLEFLKNIDSIADDHSAVLFCLTAIERGMYFDPQPQELHPQHRDLPSLSYYSHIYSQELANHNRLKNVLLVQELCEKFKVPLMFVCNWNSPPIHSLLRSHRFYHKSLVEILGIKNFEDDNNFFVTREQCKYIKPNQGHPNVQGHDLIAQELTNWIKEKI